METQRGDILFAHAKEKTRDDYSTALRRDEFFVQNARTVGELEIVACNKRFNFVVVHFQLCRDNYEVLFSTILEMGLTTFIIVVSDDEVYERTKKDMLDHGAREVIQIDELDSLLRKLGVLRTPVHS